MTEQQLQQRLRILFGTGPTRLFRNNVGTGWAGPIERVAGYCQAVVHRGMTQAVISLRPGDIIVRNARPLHAGLGVGSSDLIGWHSIVITPQHVGQRLAVFTALEVKAPRGRATAEQLAFVATVQRMGGIADIVRSEEQVRGLLALASTSRYDMGAQPGPTDDHSENHPPI